MRWRNVGDPGSANPSCYNALMMRESDIYELRLFDRALVVFRMSRGEYGELSVEVLSTDLPALAG